MQSRTLLQQNLLLEPLGADPTSPVKATIIDRGILSVSYLYNMLLQQHYPNLFQLEEVADGTMRISLTEGRTINPDESISSLIYQLDTIHKNYVRVNPDDLDLIENEDKTLLTIKMKSSAISVIKLYHSLMEAHKFTHTNLFQIKREENTITIALKRALPEGKTIKSIVVELLTQKHPYENQLNFRDFNAPRQRTIRAIALVPPHQDPNISEQDLNFFGTDQTQKVTESYQPKRKVTDIETTLPSSTASINRGLHEGEYRIPASPEKRLKQNEDDVPSLFDYKEKEEELLRQLDNHTDTKNPYILTPEQRTIPIFPFTMDQAQIPFSEDESSLQQIYPDVFNLSL